MIGTTAKLESTAGPLQWNPSQSTDVWALAQHIRLFHPEGGARSLRRSDPSFPPPSSGIPGGIPIPHQRYLAGINVLLSIYDVIVRITRSPRIYTVLSCNFN